MIRLSTLPLLVRSKPVTVDPGLITTCSEEKNRHWKSDDLQVPSPSVSLCVEKDRSQSNYCRAAHRDPDLEAARTGLQFLESGAGILTRRDTERNGFGR
jgi:hypothetical protein